MHIQEAGTTLRELAVIDLSVIIINWNTRELLLQTVGSVYDSISTRTRIEIIVVDNASTDGSGAALTQTFPEVQLIANADNRGFGPANNQALRVAQGRYSLLLNSDTIVQSGSLARIIAFMDEHSTIGMCGIRVLNPDGTFQGSWARYLTLWSEVLILTGLGRRLLTPYYPSASPAQSKQSGLVDTIQGAFMFLRTDAIKAIHGLDENFFMYGEENDLSLRLSKAGWATYYLADESVVHFGGQSTRQNKPKMAWQLQSSKVRLFRKHRGRLSALLLKVLISLALLTKLILWHLRSIGRHAGAERTAFTWSEFRYFWRI